MTEPAHHTNSFLTTHWSQVERAQAATVEGREALADLCATYYQPVATFLLYELRNAGKAEEAAQAFFEKLLAGASIQAANSDSGRFRSYLLGAVKHFLSHQRDAEACLKRGGGVVVESLDSPAAQAALASGLSPDQAFDKQWALTTLSHSMERLRQECVAAKREAQFLHMRPLLDGEAAHGSQEAVAQACGLSVTALRMALHRLRLRLRHHVKSVVAETLEDPARADDEMQALFAALSD